MKQSLLILSTVFIALFLVAGAYVFRARTIAPANNATSRNAKIQVVASFYPLGEFARQVGGESAAVSVIVPAGVEPHEYEPTPQDIASIYAADVFIVNGAGIDAWAEKIQSDLESKGVKVIVMSQILGFENDTSDVSGVNSKSIDPHFWLDPILAQQETVALRDIFSEVDKNHEGVYTENAQVYTEKLQELDRSYRNNLNGSLAVCRNKTIVTSHDALGYLAKRYAFEAVSITGLSPESEPSTRQLADLATLARQKNIRYIFFETLVSPRLAQTLANEIGAQTLVFNPLEGLTDDEVAQGKDYISVMRENLNNLQIAMECYDG